MYRKCLIYESDRDEAKDILQDSFIKIFRNIGSFDGKRPIRAWMLKITTNTAIDHFRRSTKVSGYIPIDNIDPPDISEESITAALNGKDIISQVNRLPDGARMIFKLHAIEGYTHRRLHTFSIFQKAPPNRRLTGQNICYSSGLARHVETQ